MAAPATGSLVAPLVAALFAEACARGAPHTEMLAALGVEAHELLSQDRRVELPRLLAAWEIAMRSTDDCGLPIAVGKLASIERFGLLGYTLYTRSTFRAGMEALLRFHDVLNDTGRWQLEGVAGGLTRVHWFRPGPRTLGMRVANEQVLASAVAFTREILGPDVKLSRVRFRHPRPRRWLAHEQHFGAGIEWGAESDSVDVADDDLDRPIRGADATVGAYFDKAAEAALARMATSGTWSARVVRAIGEALARGIPTLADVARGLGTSERTARRRLAAEGQTFEVLLEGVQRERADELLTSSMALAEVALALGFSDASAFSRAYKRWTGRPPSAARRRGRDGSPVADDGKKETP